MPAKTALVDVVRVKGGENCTLLVGNLDIDAIRRAQMGQADLGNSSLKSAPPGFDAAIPRKKRLGTLAQELWEEGHPGDKS